MNQHLFVKTRGAGPHQLIVANLGNRLAITCNWRLDLVRSDVSDFNFTSE